jgi:large subunit GTPase 1
VEAEVKVQAGQVNDEDEDEDGEEDEEDEDEDEGEGYDDSLFGTSHVHTREELLGLIKRRCPRGGTTHPTVGPDGKRLATVGFVGYPNVGKSSTINVLVAAKKTNVSATPGKTKHFQTLLVPDTPGILLCDCPGLVFPTTAGSKAQMVCDGILPIDQMKDYMPPMRLLVERLGTAAFEHVYTIRLRSQEVLEEDPDAPEMAREVLMAHALMRGFMVMKGIPDESRSARVILKDAVNAKLLYVVPPPGRTFDDDGRAPTELSTGSSSSSGDSALSAAAEAAIEHKASEEAAAAAAAAYAASVGKRLPTNPTTERYFNLMKAEYDAQEGGTMHMTTGSAKGRKAQQRQKESGRMGISTMPWRPTGEAALPNRIVAQGPRVDIVQVD